MKLRTANDNGSQDAGLYTWELTTNILYADAALAYLFGLDGQETEMGLPLEDYMARVHLDDRPDLAHAIADTIQFGLPFQATYRVFQADGTVISVLAFGKCFRDRKGEPRFYSGIVFPIPLDSASSDDLNWLCVAAFEKAEQEGRTDLARILKEALVTLVASSRVSKADSAVGYCP